MGYILIAGGTGLIGTRLCELLQEKGYETALLSRQKAGGKTKTFVWDPERGTIDPEALRNASAVINLAGAGIADTWWTPARKRVLIQSRTQPTALLGKMLQSTPNQVETYISASGIGIYGDTGDTLLDENAPSGNDFLAECTRIWETAFGEVEQLPLRTAAIRIGIVLSPEGGAMAKILLPFRFRIGAYFGKGRQWYSWIHIDDLCRLFIHALENPAIRGKYNAVAPQPVTNKEFTKTIGKVLGGLHLIASVPSFLLRSGMGEMADAVLNSNRVSSKKVEASGFAFRFPELEPALRDLLL